VRRRSRARSSFPYSENSGGARHVVATAAAMWVIGGKGGRSCEDRAYDAEVVVEFDNSGVPPAGEFVSGL
jgi:hypothetical protein